MALKSAAQCDFAIPELVLLVSEYLNSRDLAQCTRVCRAWSRQFEPVLWTNFCLKENRICYLDETRSSPFMVALMRNLPRIRTLKAVYTYVTLLRGLTGYYSTGPIPLCTNLKRLEFEGEHLFSIDSSSQYVATLLDLNPRLTHLRLPFESFATDAVLSAVSKLDCLQHLSVYSLLQCKNTRTLAHCLRTCLPLPNLTELIFDLEFAWEKFLEDTFSGDTDTDSPPSVFGSDRDIVSSNLCHILKEASIDRFSRSPSATKIKSLQLPSNRDQNWNPLPMVFLESNLLDLESCEIPWFGRETDSEQVERIVRQHCPNLKYLTCPAFGDVEEEGDRVCAFILGCSGLRSFVSHKFMDRYEDDSVYENDESIISTLAEHHSNTLEVFELTECDEAYSSDQQRILCECEQLSRFWVLSDPSHTPTYGITTTDTLKENWICMELKELGLTLDRFPIVDVFAELEAVEYEAEDIEDELDAANRLYTMAAESVYMQIGQLTKLETLVLDLRMNTENKGRESECAWDLTLSRGWLGELVDLKRLKVLRLQADFWSGMGQAEVEFIHEQWPLLTEISLRGNVLPLDLQSPWLWLLHKRPNLRLLLDVNHKRTND
ncbi:hypothetical protein EC968_009978 [Mortierella alpina]|nr:hypothetical protein EC968_009978 [Mortierella alpina]